MTRPWRSRAKAFVYRLIRPFVVADVGRDERFTCMICREPVLRRQLTCSPGCRESCDLAMRSPREIQDR